MKIKATALFFTLLQSTIAYSNQLSCDAFLYQNRPIHYGDKPKTLMRLDKSDFISDRRLIMYTKLLPGLKERITQATEDHHWIDLGAGNGRAIFDYYSLSNGQARVTAISYSESAFKGSNKTKLTDEQISKFRFLNRKLFEEIPLDHLEPADTISDLFGVITYAPDLKLVLSKALGLLKPNGLLFIYNGMNSSKPVTSLQAMDGSKGNIGDYLSRSRNLEVTVIKYSRGLYFQEEAYLIRKIGEFNPSDLPDLELVKYDDGGRPPSRIYNILE